MEVLDGNSSLHPNSQVMMDSSINLVHQLHTGCQPATVRCYTGGLLGDTWDGHLRSHVWVNVLIIGPPVKWWGCWNSYGTTSGHFIDLLFCHLGFTTEKTQDVWAVWRGKPDHCKLKAVFSRGTGGAINLGDKCYYSVILCQNCHFSSAPPLTKWKKHGDVSVLCPHCHRCCHKVFESLAEQTDLLRFAGLQEQHAWTYSNFPTIVSQSRSTNIQY